MSFGGAVSAMAASLKNNARTKRKNYFDRNSINSKSGNGERNALLDKKATPEQLAEIRKEMLKENSKERIKMLVIIGILIIFILSALLFFSNYLL